LKGGVGGRLGVNDCRGLFQLRQRRSLMPSWAWRTLQKS